MRRRNACMKICMFSCTVNECHCFISRTPCSFFISVTLLFIPITSHTLQTHHSLIPLHASLHDLLSATARGCPGENYCIVLINVLRVFLQLQQLKNIF